MAETARRGGEHFLVVVIARQERDFPGAAYAQHNSRLISRAASRGAKYWAPLKTHDFRADDASNRDRVLVVPIF